MKKEQFYKVLQAIYLELQDRQSQLNSFYELLEGGQKAKQSVEVFNLPSNDDTIMAALTVFDQKHEWISCFEAHKEAFTYTKVDDLVSRAIGLMAWIEVGEILPYYCEGLICLGILFGSQVICFEE
jgi:hypothetical protein